MKTAKKANGSNGSMKKEGVVGESMLPEYLSCYFTSNKWLEKAVLFWCWESIIHHFYFIVLFVQRQLSELPSGNLWQLVLEKECEFFELLFPGGSPKMCAKQSIIVFTSLFFETNNPNENQLDFIGRMITNYQHTESIFHFAMVFTGLGIVYYIGNKMETPSWLRWSFFVSCYLETWIMCVPYLYIFLIPFTRSFRQDSYHPIADVLAKVSKNEFVDGFRLGAAFGAFYWISLLVLFLDGWATYRAWTYANNGKRNMQWLVVSIAVPFMFCYMLEKDHFSPQGRGNLSHATFDGLADLFPEDGVLWFRGTGPAVKVN